MSEADYYAPGSYYDPNAPWNEAVIPEEEFDVMVSQTLSRNTTISTNRYNPEYDDETGHVYINTDDTDWKEAYEEVAMTPLEIIEACEKIAKALLEEGKTRFAGIYLKSLVEECQDWNNDELEIQRE